MVKLVTSSVVRGSQQGESHGGVYLIDFENELVEQKLDWDTVNIDWQGRGWDRGLRGICFDDEKIYIAASDGDNRFHNERTLERPRTTWLTVRKTF